MAHVTSPPSQHHRPLARLASFSYRRRRLVVLGWLLGAVAVVALSSSFAGEYSADYSAHGSDSESAQQVIDARFPTAAGQTIDVVVRADDGLAQADVRSDVEALLGGLATLPHVVAVDDLFGSPDGVSTDGRTGIATLHLDVPFTDSMDVADTQRILDAVDAAERPGLQVEVGAGAVMEAEATAVSSELVGIVAAIVILLLAFGTVVAAGLPILVALLGLLIGSALIGLLANVIETPDWAVQLAAMIALGVGIDYVLLMLTRFREYMARGLDPAHAVVATVESSGRAVLVAGTTVVISMFGLFATDLNYMQGASVATIASVLVIMLAAVTLVPALLGFAGRNVDRLRLPGARHRSASGSPAWTAWSRRVQQRAWPAAAVSVLVLVVLTLPFFGLRFGFPDAGNEPAGSRTRVAHDLMVDGFGPGVGNQLYVVAELAGAGDLTSLDRLADRVRQLPGVAGVGDPQPNPDGDAALLTVVPATSPQESATDDLVDAVRALVPGVVGDSGDRVHVGGGTALAMDSTEDIVSTLPLLVGGVVGLSFLLLLVVFRSIAVAVKAAVLNVLSIGAAYGVVAYFMQGGWAGGLIGIDGPTPLPAFIPVLMFAILFGLSMDYEVFLISRIREYWLHTGDASEAVTLGLAATARVITAAAAIMVAVFSAFVLAPDVFLKALGVGLATAILIDATIIRMVLVPATMQILGRSTWWLPGWLDRVLPQFHVEAPADAEELPDIPAQRVIELDVQRKRTPTG
jgi:putative drug exporter of the RND superfamily